MDVPANYTIKVCGVIDAMWFAYYDNMVLEIEGSDDSRPVTTLTGPVADQAALISMLTLLYDMRCPLISVECLKQE
jgi:hypothetical protein